MASGTFDIFDRGIDLIRWLASHRTPAGNVFFLAFTGAGSTVAYLAMLVVISWSISRKLGAWLLLALVLSLCLNHLLKNWIALPRPFLYARVDNLTTPDEYSFPSGHAQHAALFWGLLMIRFRNRWFRVAAMLMVFLIGFSRIYLGVHFPTDVLAGWMVGALLAWIYASAWRNDEDSHGSSPREV